MSIGLAFGCGRCWYCRRQKAKVWTHRIILEAAQHTDNAFVTLTYSDENLPPNGTLVPRDVQLFLKRLRKASEPARIRFFLVGEYGTRTRRPHYHLALFGYPACTAPYVRRGQPCRCAPCIGIASAWSINNVPIGFITNGTLDPSAAGYVAAYATKSMSENDHDQPTPDGCIPQFSRQSLRPGIGAGVCDDIASALLQNETTDIQDIPTYLSHGRDQRPLGRYLRHRILARVGHSKESITHHGITRLENKLLPLRQIALAAKKGSRHWQFREEIVNLSENKRLQIQKRYSIYRQKRKLT